MNRALLALLATMLAVPAGAAPAMRAHPRPSAMTAEVNPGTGATAPLDLEARELQVSLPGRGTLRARRTHVQRDHATATWSGEFDSVADGDLTITRYRGVTTGVAHLDGRTFELRPVPGGTLQWLALDPADLSPLEPPPEPLPAGARKPAAFDAAVAGLPTADTAPVTQDALILYTQASARRHGTAVLESMIVGAVAAANTAYRDSGVGITLRLVGLQPAATITEAPGGMVDTLARLKGSSEAATLRDRLGADVVLLVNESRDWCGYAYIMHRPSFAYAVDAFAAVRSKCLSSESVAHELGHLQGLVHDRETSNADGALPYGHGYRRCERGGFRDVMAYECPDVDVPRLRAFSNPDRLYRGVPMGIAYETDPARSADAARALNATAAIVAGYRSSATDAPPERPSDLTARSRGGAAVLAWRGVASGRGEYVVERTIDSAFVEIARVDAGRTTFVDTTVEPRRIYSYRVRAVDGGGLSAASNVVTVTIAADDGPARPIDRESRRLGGAAHARGVHR